MKSRFLLFAFAVMAILVVIALTNKMRSGRAVTAPAQTFVDEPAPNRGTVGSDEELPATEDEPEREIVKGETTVLIQAFEGLNVKNLVPVADEDVVVSLGSQCDLPAEGTLTVVGFDGDDVLVRFRNSTKILRKKTTKEATTEAEAVYPDCPSGTLLFLNKSIYLNVTEPSGADIVQRLLKDEHPAKR